MCAYVFYICVVSYHLVYLWVKLDLGGGGVIYDLLRNTGGKLKCYVSLHRGEGVKNDQN